MNTTNGNPIINSTGDVYKGLKKADIDKEVFDILLNDYIDITIKLGVLYFGLNQYRDRKHFIEKITRIKWRNLKELKKWKKK